MSSSPGELLRVKKAALEAPFLAPLSKMATLGLRACTNVGDPAEIQIEPTQQIVGQTNAYSLVQVKSPSSMARNDRSARRSRSSDRPLPRPRFRLSA